MKVENKKMFLKALSVLASMVFIANFAVAGEERQKMPEVKKGKSNFSECVAVEVYTLSPKYVNKGNQPEDTTKVPEGWTVVGGAGGGGHPTMLICR